MGASNAPSKLVSMKLDSLRKGYGIGHCIYSREPVPGNQGPGVDGVFDKRGGKRGLGYTDADLDRRFQESDFGRGGGQLMDEATVRRLLAAERKQHEATLSHVDHAAVRSRSWSRSRSKKRKKRQKRGRSSSGRRRRSSSSSRSSRRRQRHSRSNSPERKRGSSRRAKETGENGRKRSRSELRSRSRRRARARSSSSDSVERQGAKEEKQQKKNEK